MNDLRRHNAGAGPCFPGRRRRPEVSGPINVRCRLVPASLALASCASDSCSTFAPAIAVPSAHCVMLTFFHPPPTSTPRLQLRHQPIRDGGLMNGSRFICFADWYVAPPPSNSQNGFSCTSSIDPSCTSSIDPNNSVA